jgi:hypothetical protein
MNAPDSRNANNPASGPKPKPPKTPLSIGAIAGIAVAVAVIILVAVLVPVLLAARGARSMKTPGFKTSVLPNTNPSLYRE